MVVRKQIKQKLHTRKDVKDFFAHSEYLDAMVLRPLSHISANWEAQWNDDQYEPEPDSFAGDLNLIIEQIAATPRPNRYHDHEDRVAQRVIDELGWPIQKIGGLWRGGDYQMILEQGAFRDVGQQELGAAAAGRVHAALDLAQMHFDEMEERHLAMLAGLMTIMIYHRHCDGSSVMLPDED